MQTRFELPHDGFQIDADRGLVTQRLDAYDWPPNCCICGEPCTRRQNIRGVRRSFLALLWLYISSCFHGLPSGEIRTWVHCCGSCVVSRYVCNAFGAAVFLLLALGSLMLLDAAGFQRGPLMGLALFVLFGSPFLCVWLARLGSRYPAVWTFTKTTITMRFRSKEFVARMQQRQREEHVDSGATASVTQY